MAAFANNTSANNARQAAYGDELSAIRQENLQLKLQIAELERLVRVDTLTPLYNRRHFMDILDRWIWRAHRYGEDSGLLFIDVDQLKNVNDALGHNAGDYMLIAIAELLKIGVRRSDIVARIGGDEFGILLEKVDAESLPAKAQKITQAVAAAALNYEGVDLQPSISVGYAMIEPNVLAAEILMRADKAMYADKIGKRDRLA
jgi:diguanylate cyclase (GGDEF)-like protein